MKAVLLRHLLSELLFRKSPTINLGLYHTVLYGINVLKVERLAKTQKMCFILYKPCFNTGPCSMNFQVLQSQFLSLNVLKISIWNVLQKHKNKDQIFLYIQCDRSLFVPMDIKHQKDRIKLSWLRYFHSQEAAAKQSPGFYQPYELKGMGMQENTPHSHGSPSFSHTKLMWFHVRK